MQKYIYLFDLDSTITAEEILPKIARLIGKEKEMKDLTEEAMAMKIPFAEGFLARVELLKDIPIKQVREVVREIKLNSEIVKFIQENKESCYIITGNIDVWIEGLMEDLDMQDRYFSSKGEVSNGKLERVISVIDKHLVSSQFPSPIIGIGDGTNDSEMIRQADIGIGYGGVREVSSAVINCATHVIYEEDTLCQFLRQLS